MTALVVEGAALEEGRERGLRNWGLTGVDGSGSVIDGLCIPISTCCQMHGKSKRENIARELNGVRRRAKV